MKILNYSAGYDTGGQSIRFKQAFDKYSDHEYRSCVTRHSYIAYPTDAPAIRAHTLAKWADVIHVAHHVPGFRNRHGAVNNIGKGKPLVVHYHGTLFRNDPEYFLARQREADAEGVCSTLDLWLLSPEELTWIPACYDLDWLASFRQTVVDGTIRIGHSPTARKIKSTAAFLGAVERLSEEMPVTLVMAERRPWIECLRMKGTVDFYYDQAILGYGNNAIEAWGMGIPVVAGAADETIDEMTRRFGRIPFYPATEDTIYEALRAMCNPLTRAFWSKVGADHVRKWHSEPAVVAMLEDVYKKALARRD